MRIPVITCASGASWDGQVQEESSRAAQRGRKRQRPTLNVQNRYSNLVEGSMLFPWSTTNEIHRVDMYTWKMSSDRLYSCTHAAPVGGIVGTRVWSDSSSTGHAINTNHRRVEEVNRAIDRLYSYEHAGIGRAVVQSCAALSDHHARITHM